MRDVENLPFEEEIRTAVEIGNPWALDNIIDEVCGGHIDLMSVVSAIVADEYRRRLSVLPLSQVIELYRVDYLEQTDANKDWLLGELAQELIIQG